ncbi:DUF7269 family protein [Halomarina rubra]|uniref:Uncharacterized protein n=1 Tax=Halomarina rubra TaxID=2071873 RepID=A0ABD6B1U0_9EURY|nr:hypothetical protein [Halomarina rubra]
MASLRRALWYLFVVLGVLVFGGAMAVVLVPGLGEALPVDAAITALGSDYLVVAGLAVVALGVLVVMLVARAASSVDEAAPPEPEYVEYVPVLGAEFDDLVDDGLGVRETYFSDRPEEVREDLREQATRTLMRARGVAREDARALVESGRWTDDEAASQFLATNGAAPRSARIRAALRGESWLQYGARAAADEIVAVAREAASNGTASTSDPGETPGPTGTPGGAQ